MDINTLITGAIFGTIGFSVLGSMIVITSQQHVKIVETFGKFSSARKAGLSVKLPWPIQSASADFSLKIREISENVTVKSIDNAFVSVPIRVQFRVEEANADRAYYRLDDPEGQIRSYVVNQVRSSASGLTFDELFQSRDHFERGVEETLTEKMSGFGFVIENVLVDDPQPSQDLREAFDRVIASKRLREAAENEGEAKRLLAVAEANAEGEALEIKGRAWSQFRKTVAEGNAEALTKFTGDTGLPVTAGLEFFNSINEMEAVRDAAHNGGKIVFITSAAKSASGDPATLGMVAAQDGATPKAKPAKS